MVVIFDTIYTPAMHDFYFLLLESVHPEKRVAHLLYKTRNLKYLEYIIRQIFNFSRCFNMLRRLILLILITMIMTSPLYATVTNESQNDFVKILTYDEL